ncbi:MAG: hypothetical protein LBN01_03090 [Endomicrobium sp.]|nr:hypothetical protein [Endomicrobium sp.]
MLCYDKKVIKGNNLKIEIREVAKDLEFETVKLSNMVSMLRTAIRELNEYELNDQYRLKAELIKENNQWYVLAERTLKEGEAVKQLIQSVAQPQKNISN